MARLDNHFSWKTATFMAKLAKHAYDKPAVFKKAFKKDKISVTADGILDNLTLHHPNELSLIHI